MGHALTNANGYCSGAGVLSVDEALACILERARPITDRDSVETINALGRVLAEDQIATLDVPGHDNSAMDGYAVLSRDTTKRSVVSLRVSERIRAGRMGSPLSPGCAARIFTGAPIPPGADAVVMQEECEVRDGQVLIRRVVRPGENIRPRGNDTKAGDTILPRGIRLHPQHMALAASAGLAYLPLTRRLRVAIFFTGDELREPGFPLQTGQIYNSNRFALHGLLTRLGCEVLDLGIVRDNLDATRVALRKAAPEADVVITSGGVSVGDEDHVKQAVEFEGRLDLWRIAMKPGKPLAFGAVAETPFVGLPGNPVSTLATFLLFVRPYLLRMQGVTEVAPLRVQVVFGFDRPHATERREYVRVRLETNGSGATVAQCHHNQGSDVLSTAVWAQGLVEIPEQRSVIRGDSVPFLPFSELLS